VSSPTDNVWECAKIFRYVVDEGHGPSLGNLIVHSLYLQELKVFRQKGVSPMYLHLFDRIFNLNITVKALSIRQAYEI